jgi:hypothetical protein
MPIPVSVTDKPGVARELAGNIRQVLDNEIQSLLFSSGSEHFSHILNYHAQVEEYGLNRQAARFNF